MTNAVLTRNRLEQLAPSIYQGSAMDHLSEKYNFIPTSTVIDEMEHLGWLPVKATESRVRSESKRGYQKHMIRFRNFDESEKAPLDVGDEIIELVLTNSHDGLSSFVFNLGVFRLVCSNGMVVPEHQFDTKRIRHNSYDAQNVIEICRDTARIAPEVISEMDRMRAIDLTPEEQTAFGNAAKVYRFDNPDSIDTEQVLRARRMSDRGDSLWKTFNRVQENLEKGGVAYSRFDENGRYTGRGSTREVKSIDTGIKLNQALWTLANEVNYPRLNA